MKAKILVIWLITYVLGVMIAPVVNISYEICFLLGALICLISALLFRKTYIFALVVGLGVVFLAMGNFGYRANRLITINTKLAGKNIVTNMVVNDIPQKTPYGERVGVRIVTLDGQKATGVNILVYLPQASGLKYADIVTAEIKPKQYSNKSQWSLVKGNYAGEANVAKIKKVGVSKTFWDNFHGWLLAMRISLNNAISRALPATEAGLASGLILGEKALVTPEMTRLLQASGTTHIIALSGYNVTIIMGLFIFMRRRFSRLINLLVPVGIILLFTIMTGAAPSLVRAALMGFLPLLGRYLGRESDNFIAILLSAVLMSVFNPFLPMFDVGFQLSFVAFVGISYISPIIQGFLKKWKIASFSILSETVGAQIATLPLLLYYFGTFSIVSPFANILVLTLVPAGMLMAFFVGILGMISSTLGSYVAIPTYVLLHFMIESIRYFGSLPWAAVNIKMANPVWIAIAYVAVFDFWFLFRRLATKSSE